LAAPRHPAKPSAAQQQHQRTEQPERAAALSHQSRRRRRTQAGELLDAEKQQIKDHQAGYEGGHEGLDFPFDRRSSGALRMREATARLQENGV
jgi:hypothetical protein